jgi:hypothetical protein
MSLVVGISVYKSGLETSTPALNTLADIESVATGENSEVIEQLVETVSDLTERVSHLEAENDQLRQQLDVDILPALKGEDSNGTVPLI